MGSKLEKSGDPLTVHRSTSEPLIRAATRRARPEPRRYRRQVQARGSPRPARRAFMQRVRTLLWKRLMLANTILKRTCVAFVHMFRYTFCFIIMRNERRKDVVKSAKI